MGVLVEREGRFQGWEYSEEMTAGTNSDPIAIPPLDQGATVSITFVTSTGAGKIQFTTSLDSLLSTAAVWQDWPDGACTETTSDALISPVTGLRLVRTSGTVGIEIKI